MHKEIEKDEFVTYTATDAESAKIKKGGWGYSAFETEPNKFVFRTRSLMPLFFEAKMKSLDITINTSNTVN